MVRARFGPPRSLYFWVIVGIALGVTVGALAPSWGKALQPLGTGFINLIKMMIGPIIFCTIVHGIAGVGDLRQAGRIGLKALIYFEVVTTLALLIGLGVGNTVRPGAGMNIDPASLDTSKLPKAAPEQSTVAGFLLHVIPKTAVSAFTEGELLQVVLVALLFASALAIMIDSPSERRRDSARSVLAGVERLTDVLFQIIGLVMKLAPIGAFGAMAFTVGEYGLASLRPLLGLMACFYTTALLFVFVVLGLILWASCGIGLWRLLVYLKDELLIVLGTSSSESALPSLMEKLERLGCAKPVVSLVVPTGYTFNLDGTSIYLTMAALFIAQATGTHLTVWQQAGLLGIMLLTSKGAAAVTGGGFVVLAATLGTVGHVPPAGVVLVLGVDRFMSEARALTNFVGNAVGTLVIARWEGALDRKRVRAILHGEPEADLA